jgi:hypothetical protein
MQSTQKQWKKTEKNWFMHTHCAGHEEDEVKVRQCCDGGLNRFKPVWTGLNQSPAATAAAASTVQTFSSAGHSVSFSRILSTFLKDISTDFWKWGLKSEVLKVRFWNRGHESDVSKVRSQKWGLKSEVSTVSLKVRAWKQGIKSKVSKARSRKQGLESKVSTERS